MKISVTLMFLVVLIGLSACGPASTPPPTLTPLPSSTHTPIPTNTPLPTHTPPPPTETPVPTPTIPPEIWLDPQQYELTLHHPLDENQSNWESIYEVVIPVDGYVAGVIFTVDESDITWGPAASISVPGKGSVLRRGSMRRYSSGLYCVSDYFLSYTPDSACQILAPDSIPLNWITSYFAGYKTQVGVAFQIGGCDPANCTVDLVISKIQLIMYNPE